LYIDSSLPFYSRIQLFSIRLRAHRTGFTNLSRAPNLLIRTGNHDTVQPRIKAPKPVEDIAILYERTRAGSCRCCERCRLRPHSLPQPLSPCGYTKLATIRKHHNESCPKTLRSGRPDLLFHCRDILRWKLLVFTVAMPMLPSRLSMNAKTFARQPE
jgi:hypothetical protein